MNEPIACLTIAGSDPSGGAGIQGDLKTFCALNAYGMAVITALTAQNTQVVSGVHAVPAAFVKEQLERIYEDIPTDFVKTGMLFNREIIHEVALFFGEKRSVNLVVDPVMVSSSGGVLLQDDAVSCYVDELMPLARLMTPNFHETKLLTGLAVECVDDAIKASEILRGRGARAVLVKGGDVKFREGDDVLFDVLNDGGEVAVFERELVGSRNSHGTGCAMASAIAAYLSHGRTLKEAVLLAGEYVGNALRFAYPTGKGSGSINHLWNVGYKNI